MSSRAQSHGAPALPQVNLLPPEVTAARGLARTKRWLVFFVLVSFIGAAGLVVQAILAQQDAAAELATHQQRTADLDAELLEYSEVPTVLGALEQAKIARQVGMSTEVLWRPYLEAIAATAPPEVRIETIEMSGATPMQLPAAPVGALAAPSIATITFTAQSLTVPDIEAWLISLESIPGFADPWISLAAVTEKDAVAFYNITATVQVNEQAFALRFADPVESEEE